MASDFIFSPPGNTASVSNYLNIEEQDISISLSHRLRVDSAFSVVLLQGTSDYDGYYWNVNNEPSAFRGERPYYVLLAGKRNEIATLLHSAEKNVKKIKQSYTEMNCTPVSYEIMPQATASNGTFHLCKKGQKHHIKKSKAYKSQRFHFCVKADFSNLPLTDDYLCNTKNYATNSKGYCVTTVMPCTGEKGKYLITLAATDLKHLTAVPCEVKLKKTMPAWISQSNDPKGLKPESGKTFGLTSMTNGIKKAFNSAEDCYACLTLYVEN